MVRAFLGNLDLTGYAMARRMPEKVQRDVIAQGATGENARTVLSNLHANHDRLRPIPTRKDNNVLQKARAAEANGPKPMEALFDSPSCLTPVIQQHNSQPEQCS